MALTAAENAALDALAGKKAASTSPTPQPTSVPSHSFLPVPHDLGKENPLLPLQPVFTAAKRAVGTPVGKVFDVLNRSGAATEATALHGPAAGFKTFVHSEPPEQYQADNAELTRQNTEQRKFAPVPFIAPHGFGPVTKPAMSKEEYDKMPGWWHQANELITSIEFDPLSYAGASGVLDHLTEAVGTKSFTSFAKAVDEMQKSTNPAIQSAGHGLAGAYDLTHYKGATKRALAAKSGAEGINQFRGLKAINNARRTQALDLSRSLLHQYDDVVKGLTPDDEDMLYHAVHLGHIEALPPNLAMRAGKFKSITDQLAHLEADHDLRAQLAEHGFELPASMKRFEGVEPRGLQEAGSYRKNYVPTKHEAKKRADTLAETGGIMGLDQPASKETRSLSDILKNPEQRVEPKTSSINAEDPNLRPRPKAHLEDPDIQRRLVQARLKSGAQAIAAHDAEKRVSELFGKGDWAHVPDDAKAFFQETYNEPGGKEFWSGFARSAIDIPKVGLFALPFRHMANIGSLSFLADPSLANVYGTAGKFMRLMFARNPKKFMPFMIARDPERRAKILGVAGKYGVTGTPSVDREAAGWIGRIPGIGDLYRASNHVLWTFDDAAKATRFNRLLKKYKGDGLDESHAAYRAADQVGAELIDYSNRSPLTKALAYVLPFATYRSKVPGAITRSVQRHPEVATNIGRVSPELIGDEQQAPPDEKGAARVGKSYLPLPEVLRGAENPMEYARASAGYPLAMGTSLVGKGFQAASGRESPDVAFYATYGKDPDFKYLLNATLGSFPGGEAFLGWRGLGEFQNQGSLSGAIRGQTGFGVSRGPSPLQLKIPVLLEHAQAQADAARKRGDTQTADNIERAMKLVRERYRQFVP